MNVIFILFILQIFQSCLTEQPKSICQGLKPFKTKENSCENFTNICVKKDDKDCKSFLDICEQCPALNYSVLMFHDIVLIKVELQNTKINFNKTNDDMKKELRIITKQLRNNENKTNNIYILLWVIIGINILLMVILILEIRFKIITKLTEHRYRKAKKSNYVLLESRKSLKNISTIDSLRDIMTKGFHNISNSIECRIDGKFDQLFKHLETSREKKVQKVKFRINGYLKPLEIKVEEEDNIVQIKKQICSELPQCDKDDYKILKLKINGKLFNDNDYLPLPELLSSNDEVFCEFDKTMDKSKIVVLKIEADFNLPKFIQVEKTKSISNSLLSIHGIENSEIFSYFIEKEKSTDKQIFTQLEKDNTIEENKLNDNDIVYVIKRYTEELVIESIFEKETTVIEYSNTDYISEIRNNVAKKFNCSSNDIVLFFKNLNLTDDMFAFQYFSVKGPQVKYCRLMNFALADILITEPPLIMGCFSVLYKAAFAKRHQNILIKKYDIKMNERFEDCTHIITELKIFQITKSEERFVKLFGVYKKENYVFVSMENMEEGSLKMFLKNNTQMGLNNIAKWTYQILEGLHYLHKNNIVHRDLNPSSLLLDSSCNIKLSSFNLSKYTDFHHPSSINIGDHEIAGFPIKYLAPEIISMEIYNTKADVWSLGAILIKISTKKSPFSDVKKSDIIKKIEINKYMNYECPDSIPSGLKEFINLCMKGNPNERASVEILQKDQFIRDYYQGNEKY